jgi:hypothetical protein
LQVKNILEINMSNSSKPSLGWAVFILIAGVALLAERLGWIPSDVQWGLPAVLIAFGVTMLYSYFKE